MFFKDKSFLRTTLMLLMNNSDNAQLMNSINKVFTYVKLEDIADKKTQELCKATKQIAEDITKYGLRSAEAAKDYVSNSSIDPETKKFILSMKYRVDDPMVQKYNYLFSKMKWTPLIEAPLDKLITAYDKLKKSGIDTVDKDVEHLIDVTREYEEVVRELSKDTNQQDLFMVDITEDNNPQSIGMDKLESHITVTESNKVKTGMWIDNLSGGGFSGSNLYLVAAIGGGGKSAILQNIAERISTYMKPEDFLIPTGVKPAIYYLNLEMTAIEVLERKLLFYGHSLEEAQIEIDNSEGSRRLKDVVANVLREHKALIPILYEQGESDYDIADIKVNLNKAKLEGYHVVAVIIDYADLLKGEMSAMDQFAMNAPIVKKMTALRSLAKEFNVPVITAAQLNREAEREIKQNEHRASSEDLILKLSSAQIGKAYGIKAIPEQIYICDMRAVNGNWYMSVIVDKDRQNKARFIPLPNKEKKEKEGKKYKKNHRTTTRITYISPVENFKISDDYSNTIRDYEDTEDSIFDTMEVDEIK